MPTEDFKNQMILRLLEFHEEVEKNIAMSKAMQAIPFHMLSPDLWSAIQSAQPGLQEILEGIKTSLPNGGKIVDNDAAWAHMTAVLDADR
jgi:hypothetical protein